MVVSHWLVSPALLVQLPVAAFSLVFMAMLCLRCRDRRPLVIHQGALSDDYVQQNTFRVIHPYQNSTGAGGIPSPLFPSSPVVPERRPSFTPTENESIPSYITPVEEQDPFQDDYIEVLEDPPRDGPGVETQSVDSGSATEGDYVNWDKKNQENQENQDLSEDDSADNYINVPPRNSDQNSTGAGGIPSPLFPSSPVVPERRPSFMPTENASTDSDYDNDEGDYVNQPVFDIQHSI